MPGPSDYNDLDKYPTLPLGVSGGFQPNVGEDDRGFSAPVETKSKLLNPSLESVKDGGDSGTGMRGSVKASPPPPKVLTPAEMMLQADAMQKAMQAQHDARMAQGPAVRRLADGNPDNGFNTELTQGAEKAYQNQFGDKSNQDYDLKGAFAAHQTDNQLVKFTEDGKAYFPNHLTDTYKKPTHDTFSDESQYADYGYPGRWNGEQFQPSPAQVPPPTWLTGFMQTQAAMPVFDTSKATTYSNERDQLRAIKAQSRL
jgi:hypothetical protein